VGVSCFCPVSVHDGHCGSGWCVPGVVSRGEAGPGSDIDLLVDMEEGRSLLDLAGIHLELDDLLAFPVAICADVRPRLVSVSQPKLSPRKPRRSFRDLANLSLGMVRNCR